MKLKARQKKKKLFPEKRFPSTIQSELLYLVGQLVDENSQVPKSTGDSPDLKQLNFSKLKGKKSNVNPKKYDEWEGVVGVTWAFSFCFCFTVGYPEFKHKLFHELLFSTSHNLTFVFTRGRCVCGCVSFLQIFPGWGDFLFFPHSSGLHQLWWSLRVKQYRKSLAGCT